MHLLNMISIGTIQDCKLLMSSNRFVSAFANMIGSSSLLVSLITSKVVYLSHVYIPVFGVITCTVALIFEKQGPHSRLRQHEKMWQQPHVAAAPRGIRRAIVVELQDLHRQSTPQSHTRNQKSCS